LDPLPVIEWPYQELDAGESFCHELWSRNFSIAPAIYHFLILYNPFANLKNLNFLRLHQHSRNL
jgi:hypothetical protein